MALPRRKPRRILPAASMPEIVKSRGIRTAVTIWLTRSHQAIASPFACSIAQ